MSSKIFISYRRDDSKSESREIYGMLQGHFGKHAVFMDISTIKPGDKWEDKIKTDLVESNVVLFVIKDAKKWIGVDDWGDIRIHEEEDWVRQELELAIKEGKKIVPLLIKGAKFPPINKLPKTLHPLLGFQPEAISFDDTWEDDQQKIVNACQDDLDHAGISAQQSPDPVALEKKFGPFWLLAAVLQVAESNELFRKHIDGHRRELCDFVKNVCSVRETKELHDIAHNVQVDGLGPFKKKLMGTLSSDLEWDFPDEHYIVQEALKSLRVLQSENESIREKEPWFEDFNIRLMGLDTAIRNDDVEFFKQEVNALDSLLKKQQMSLNKRLIYLVDNDLHLKEVVVQLIEALKLSDKSYGPNHTSKINSVSEILNLFMDDFIWLRDVHDIWHEIDKELSLLETQLFSPNSAKESIIILSDIERHLEKAFNKGEPEQLSNYVTTMRLNQRKLRDKLFRSRSTDQNTDDLQRALILFSDPARKIFRAIDKNLKEKCNDLVKLEGVVNDLLNTHKENGDRYCA